MGRFANLLSLKAGLLLAVCFALPMARGCGYESAVPKDRSPAAFTSEVVDERTAPPTAEWGSALAMFLVPHLFGVALAWRHGRALLSKSAGGGLPGALLALLMWLAAIVLVFTSVGERDADRAGLLCAGLAGVFVIFIPGGVAWAMFQRRLRSRWADLVETAGAGLCVWWFGCWAIFASMGDTLTTLGVQPLYGLYLGLGASGVALATGAARLAGGRAVS